MHNSLLLDKF